MGASNTGLGVQGIAEGEQGRGRKKGGRRRSTERERRRRVKGQSRIGYAARLFACVSIINGGDLTTEDILKTWKEE